MYRFESLWCMNAALGPMSCTEVANSSCPQPLQPGLHIDTFLGGSDWKVLIMLSLGALTHIATSLFCSPNR